MSPTLTEPDYPPRYNERQKAVYIGRVTEADDDEPRLAYYLHSHDALALGDISNEAFVPVHTVEADPETMGEAAACLAKLPGTRTKLSDIGQALTEARVLAQTDVLGVKQAHVLVIRTVYGFSQEDTAKILDIGFSTVSSHLSDARQNAQNAIDFAERYRDLTGGDTEPSE